MPSKPRPWQVRLKSELGLECARTGAGGELESRHVRHLLRACHTHDFTAVARHEVTSAKAEAFVKVLAEGRSMVSGLVLCRQHT